MNLLEESLEGALKSLSIEVEFFAVPHFAQIRHENQQKPNAN
jgi:hypothetical protein